MQYQVIENMQKVPEWSMETAKRLQAFHTRLCDAWTGRQLEAAALWIDAGIKQLRLLGEAQNPYDFYAGQAQLAQEYMERATEYCRQGLTALTDLQRDVGPIVVPPSVPREVAVYEGSTPAHAPRSVAAVTPAAEPGKVRPSVP